jgi:hypothetical protein
MGQPPESGEKKKKTRTMTPEMLEKLALARQKALEVKRKLKEGGDAEKLKHYQTKCEKKKKASNSETKPEPEEEVKPEPEKEVVEEEPKEEKEEPKAEEPKEEPKVEEEPEKPKVVKPKKPKKPVVESSRCFAGPVVGDNFLLKETQMRRTFSRET